VTSLYSDVQAMPAIIHLPIYLHASSFAIIPLHQRTGPARAVLFTN